jgi:hypothetical protein
MYQSRASRTSRRRGAAVSTAFSGRSPEIAARAAAWTSSRGSLMHIKNQVGLGLSEESSFEK